MSNPYIVGQPHAEAPVSACLAGKADRCDRGLYLECELSILFDEVVEFHVWLHLGSALGEIGILPGGYLFGYILFILGKSRGGRNFVIIAGESALKQIGRGEELIISHESEAILHQLRPESHIDTSLHSIEKEGGAGGALHKPVHCRTS